MCANAQRDGRPAYYRWRPLFNAAVWLTPTTTTHSKFALRPHHVWKYGSMVDIQSPTAEILGEEKKKERR